MTALAIAPEPSVRLIVEVVAELTGVPQSAIRSARRDAEVALARHMACWLGLRLTCLSFARIGMDLGGREASTVQHGASRIDALRMARPDLSERLDLALTIVPALAAKAEIAQAGTGPDAMDVMSRILAHPRPERVAGLASTQDVVAMAVRLRQLHLVADLAARSLTTADEAGRAHLAEALAALGYVTFTSKEEVHGEG